MARHPFDDCPDNNKQLHAWLAAWWQERAHYLSRLDVRFVEPLREDQEISVVVFPHGHHRDALGCNHEPQYLRGYELPIYLLREIFTAETADRLQVTLTMITNAQGVDSRQAVAFLIQLYLIVVDLGRATFEGKPSILLGPTWGQVTGWTNPFEDWMVEPVWRLESVLDFWAQFGERFIQGVSKSPDGSLGKADYSTIPPRWLPLEAPQHHVKDTAVPSTVPVLVEPCYAPLVHAFVEFYRTHENYGPLTIQFTPLPPACSPAEAPSPHVFRREGEFWTIIFNGETIRLKDRKGLWYLSSLLREPGREFLAADLTRTLGQSQTSPAAHIYGQMSAEQLDEEHLSPTDLGDAGVILDSRAKAEYKQRLDDLREELEEANQNMDRGRAERAQNEIDTLTNHLANAMGFGGQDRKAASASERARVNVTKAIKAALKEIAQGNPLLGRYLANRIQTGLLCSYRPDPNDLIPWSF